MTKTMTPEVFQPDWAVPPSATIAAILAARAIPRQEFAESIGESIETVNRLLLGLEEVSDDLAGRLSKSLGSSHAFWTAREAHYRADSQRIRQRDAVASLSTWVKQFPTREMRSLGWIGPYQSSKEAAEECLKFFDVPDVPTWQARYGAIASVAAFRMSTTAQSNSGAVVAWLRWAELVANRVPCKPWNSLAFRKVVIEARRLTWQKNPATFLPILRQMCCEAGVAIVIARTPPGCPASGATRFLDSQRAMIVLSFRYRSDDQFWFTFFHEAAHLLLHGIDSLFLEDESEVTADEEREANEFAAQVLVPQDYLAEFRGLRTDKASILRFARRVGVAPGLIVGQLQHRNRLPHDRLNWLKRRYAWGHIEADKLIP